MGITPIVERWNLTCDCCQTTVPSQALEAPPIPLGWGRITAMGVGTGSGEGASAVEWLLCEGCYFDVLSGAAEALEERADTLDVTLAKPALPAALREPVEL